MEHGRQAMNACRLAAGSRMRLARAMAWLVAFAALAVARSAVLSAEPAKPVLRSAGGIEIRLLPPRGEAGPSAVSVRFEPPPNGDPGRPCPALDGLLPRRG